MRAELTASQAGRVIGQNRETIRRWIHGGLMAARRVGPRGDFRISIDELRRVAALYNLDFDEETARKLAE